MNPLTHRIYISSLVTITVLVTIYLSYTGYSFYNLPLEERYYHSNYEWFKPAGTLGHGLGIVGTFMILFGVVIYIARKRYNFMTRFLRLKYLLEFHIFLCTLGSILILFHTSFKFGGIVSIAFWCMVAVVLSGVIGRFIYIQIPRTIEGRELSLQEVKGLQTSLNSELAQKGVNNDKIITLISTAGALKSTSIFDYFKTKMLVRKVANELKIINFSTEDSALILDSIKKEISLSQRIERLQTMQKYFKYWHVIHLPFALIMLVIVLIHVGVTLALGYKWIF